MKTSVEGRNLIKSFESLRLSSYYDSAGILTIGYGHTSEAGLPKVTNGMVITKQQADEIFDRDIVQYEKCVSNNVNANLNQNQFDALVSFCYNVGCKNFVKSSVLKNLNKQDFDKVPDSLMLYVYSNHKKLNGLIKRRSAEVELFLRNESGTSVPAGKKIYIPFKELFAIIAGIPASISDNPVLFIVAILAIVTVIYMTRKK